MASPSYPLRLQRGDPRAALSIAPNESSRTDATFGIDGHALKFCGQNLTKFQSVIQLQENGHLVCSVRRRDKRQPSLEQQEQSDEH
jgi:hypothetical protein